MKVIRPLLEFIAFVAVFAALWLSLVCFNN
jgi:hypothetical protein